MTHQIFWRRRETAPSVIEGKVTIKEGDTLTVGRAHDCDIMLADSSVSRRHAKISATAGQLSLTDNESSNGIFIDGRRVTSGIWHPGQTLDIGPYRLELRAAHASTGLDPIEPNKPDVFPPAFFDRPQISVKQLQASGLIEAEVDYLALGGGLGSFAWVDHLRIFGVKAERIRIIGVDAQPYAKYKRLCRSSQIPDHERLRSNSISTPDNIWGFPGYHPDLKFTGQNIDARSEKIQ